MHPAGGQLDQHADKQPEWIPNKHQWPLPEGTLDRNRR